MFFRIFFRCEEKMCWSLWRPGFRHRRRFIWWCFGQWPTGTSPQKNRKPRSSKKAAKPKGRPKAKATARVSCKAKEKKDKVKAERKGRKISMGISQACHACIILGNLSMGVVFQWGGLTQLNNAQLYGFHTRRHVHDKSRRREEKVAQDTSQTEQLQGFAPRKQTCETN